MIYVQPSDKIGEQFARNLAAIGERDASIVMNRAMNRVGRSTTTKVKRALRKQTSATAAVVNSQVRFRGSSRKRLETRLEASGQYLGLKHFNARQFSYGVRAKVWGQNRRFESAFIVGSLGSHVFIREGKARLPIRKMYGPALPREILKDESFEEFERGSDALLDRLQHELNFLLSRRN